MSKETCVVQTRPIIGSSFPDGIADACEGAAGRTIHDGCVDQVYKSSINGVINHMVYGFTTPVGYGYATHDMIVDTTCLPHICVSWPYLVFWGALETPVARNTYDSLQTDPELFHEAAIGIPFLFIPLISGPFTFSV